MQYQLWSYVEEKAFAVLRVYLYRGIPDAMAWHRLQKKINQQQAAVVGEPLAITHLPAAVERLLQQIVRVAYSSHKVHERQLIEALAPGSQNLNHAVAV